MATDIDSLQIQIDAQASKANDAIDRLIGKLDKLATSLANVDGSDKLSTQGSKTVTVSNNISKGLNKASNSATRTNKSFKSLAYVFGKFYANCFLAIRGVKALWKSINSTADYLEAFNYFEVALNKVGGDWAGDYEKYGYANAEAYADSFKKRLNESLKGLSGVQISIDANGETGLLTDTGLKNLGLNIKEVTQYASQLASVTNSVGQTGEVTLATASAFTKLGADMSSLFNTDYSTVMNNLQSAIIGQSRSVYKYGSDITNASLQTLAYSLNIEKAVSEMTQAEKMQLRIIKILQDTKVAWGDQANTINSLSNSIRQFKNNISEAGQILGQLFVPIMSKLMPIINGVTIAIKRLMVSIAGIMGVKLNLSEFGQGTSDIAEDMDGLGDSLDGVANSANAAKNGVRSFDKLNALTTSSKNEDTSIAGIDLTDDILKATEEYEKAWQEAYDRMENQAIAFADRIEKSLEPIKKIFEDISIGNWEGVGSKIGDALSNIDWGKTFESVGKAMWDGLKATFELAVGFSNSAPIATAITTAVIGIPLLIKEFSKVKTVVSQVKGVFLGLSKIVSGVSLGFSVAVVAIAALVAGLAVAYQNSQEIRDGFSNAIGLIKDGLKGILDFVTGTILPDIESGFKKISSILEPFVDFLNNVFASVWNDIINPALEYVGNTILPKLSATLENLWNNVLVPFGNFLISVLEPAIKIVSDVLSMLWKQVVIPLAKAVGSILGKAFETFSEIFNKRVIPNIKNVIKVLQFLWDKILYPIVDFLWSNLKPVYEAVFKVFESKLNAFTEKVNDILEFITGVFTLDWKKAWDSLVNIFADVFDKIALFAKIPINNVISMVNGMVSGIETAINFIVNALNSLSFTVPKWVPKIGGEKFGFNLNEVQFKKINLLQYETGGFVEPNLPNRYSLLMAGEHGTAEMLGTVGGKTAIAGGAEITGISDTIRATSNEEIALLKKQNSLLQSILEKEFGISKNDIGRAAQDYARDYSRRTGREAYSF